MYYYQFNIGDYASHTIRLSIYEDIAYRRLLDLYYLHERPFNGCSADIAKDIGMADFLSDVEFVLNKFFTEKNGCWNNKRCDFEISSYHNKKKTARKAGIASGKARKNKLTTVQRSFNDRSTTVELNKKHKTRNIKQETTTKDQNKTGLELYAWLNKTSWTEFEQHRQDIKKPLTILAAKKNLAILEKHQSKQKEIVDITIANGWAGLFPPKGENNETGKNNSKPSLAERATTAREEYEQQFCSGQDDGKSVGEDEPHLRSPVVVD